MLEQVTDIILNVRSSLDILYQGLKPCQPYGAKIYEGFARRSDQLLGDFCGGRYNLALFMGQQVMKWECCRRVSDIQKEKCLP